MNDQQVYRGARGTYILVTPSPFAHGRTSALFRVKDSAAVEWCLKEFTEAPRDPRGREVCSEFLAEIEARERIKHANILPIADHGTLETRDRKLPFIVMPLCEHDLRHGMSGRTFVPFDEAIVVLRQVSAAIDFAHSRGLVHGDVKPENILFMSGGAHALLSDFGTAHFFPFNEAMVTAISIIRGGTTAYLSPEQIERNVQTARSDIYSFATVAYEMLAGKLPIDSTLAPFPQMKAKVEGAIRDARKINPALSQAVANALALGLATDPGARPVTTGALCSLLEGARSVSSRAKLSVKTAEGVPEEEPSERQALVVGRSLYDLVAEYIPRNRFPIVLALVAALLGGLAMLAHTQTEAGGTVKLFGYELWRKGGVAPPSCIAYKRIRELGFTDGNKARFCAGSFYDEKNKYDGVFNLPGTVYADAWCFRGDLASCKAEVEKHESQSSAPSR